MNLNLGFGLTASFVPLSWHQSWASPACWSVPQACQRRALRPGRRDAGTAAAGAFPLYLLFGLRTCPMKKVTAACKERSAARQPRPCDRCAPTDLRSRLAA